MVVAALVVLRVADPFAVAVASVVLWIWVTRSMVGGAHSKELGVGWFGS